VRVRLSAPVQTGPGAHPVSYTMGTGPFPGVMRPGRGGDHPSPSSAEVKERVEVYLHSPVCAFMAGHRVNFVLACRRELMAWKCSVTSCDRLDILLADRRPPVSALWHFQAIIHVRVYM
jgi:hypothetical protein